LFRLIPSFKAYDMPVFASKTGQETKGCFILATFFPDMIEKDVYAVFSKIVKACKIAEKQGMGIVSLSGFSSIPGYRIGHEVSSELDIPVTTGKTFTAALILEAVAKAAKLTELDLAWANAVVIGGSGDVGSGCARVLAAKVKKLTITGHSRENLNKSASELKRCHKAQISLTQDNREACQDADIVVCCAGATASFIDPLWFKPGAIICDTGYPKNVSYLSPPREDVLIFDGGLTLSPSKLEIPIDFGLPDPYVTFGSFAEAIILDLEARYENFSGGRGGITPEKIDEIRGLGEKHGFVLADFYRSKRLISPAAIEEVKAARQNSEI